MSASLELGEIHEFGMTQYGERRLLDVTGGMFTGDSLDGEVLTGGLDMELTLPNAAVELEQINILRTGDGALILMRSCGFAPASDLEVRFVADFEAPNSSAHAWLNEGKYAGVRSVDEAGGSMQLEIFEISDVPAAEPSVQLEDPADLPDQPWECAMGSGMRGAEVLTENVSLGASLSVGESKRGSRNIIPITGGTVTGRLTGSVLPGGADYQIVSGGATLDARYTLVGDDGDYVLVRNCGPIGALIPHFEARQDGPYAFLNANTFLSSDPGVGGGGVSITFFERQ